MPGPIVAADELIKPSRTVDEKVRGNHQAAQGLEIRVLVPVQLIGKKLLDPAIAKLPRRQTDGVDHYQVKIDAGRAGAEIR